MACLPALTPLLLLAPPCAGHPMTTPAAPQGAPTPSAAPPSAAPAGAPPTDPPAPPDPLREELALLDLASTRRVTIPEGVETLRELVEALAAQGGIPVEVEWQSLVRGGVTPTTAPPVTRGEGSLLAVLDACCAALGQSTERPRVEAALGCLRIMAPSSAAELRRTRGYPADAIAEELVDLATSHIDPENWATNGGEVQRLSVVGGTVVVSAPATVHRRFAALLHELEATRPAGVEFTTELWRIPAAAYRSRAMGGHADDDASFDPGSIEGARRLASPGLVAAMDSSARTKLDGAGRGVELQLRPEADPQGALRANYELMMEEGELRTSASGVLPLPPGGGPAGVAVDTGGDAILLLRIRGRPLLRGATGHDGSHPDP